MPPQSLNGFKAIRVMVVDDYVPLADHLAKVLCDKGYKAIAVYSGTEALDNARLRSFATERMQFRQYAGRKQSPPLGVWCLGASHPDFYTRPLTFTGRERP